MNHFCLLRQALGRFLAVLNPSKARLLHHLPTMSEGKMSSPHFSALLTPGLLELENTFKSAGYGFRLVGGVVRDLLLGQAPKDIDIATECKPQAMLKLLANGGFRAIPTGMDHGTVTVLKDAVTYEITTLRVDKKTDGRHAVVEFVNDWKLDALRRDLTINSMSLSLDGTLYDYFEGEKHLAEKRILFVGNPHDRITEDYLRILRYFRFYGRIVPCEGRHDEPTLGAIREHAEGLRGISAERIWAEMGKILVGNHAPHLLQLMYNLGVARHIYLPVNGNMKEFERVWTGVRSRPEGEEPLKPASLLATLVPTAERFVELAAAWKLSNKEKDMGAFLATHRTVACDPGTNINYFQDLLVDKMELELVSELLRYCGRSREFWSDLRTWDVPVLPVNGHDLLGVGVPGGRMVGVVLKDLKRAWKESRYGLSREDLLGMVGELRGAKGVEGEQEAVESRHKRRKMKK